jgi:hypothetical protein
MVVNHSEERVRIEIGCYKCRSIMEIEITFRASRW